VGLGLLGIRERVALLGGTVDIETTPRKGTTLFIRVPITEASTGPRQGGSAEKGNE
jgi:two-component system sensor histidine kinase UhpB